VRDRKAPARARGGTAHDAACFMCRLTDLLGWHGFPGAAHCGTCHVTWTSKRAAHCPACCEHFTSYSASDLHDGPNGCIPPEEVPGLMLAADGLSWRRADTHTRAISAPGSAASPASTAAAVPGSRTP
jgi:hypothetical protein